MSNQPNRASLILSANRALLGAISSKMRVILIKFESDAIYIRAILDGPVSNNDRESISLASTEIAADFSDVQVYDECIRSDYPGPIPEHDGWFMVFERREP